MGLLKALGLPARDADLAAPPVKAATGARPQPSVDPAELARWPRLAHDAWKGLDHVRQMAVVAQMAAIYGQPFAAAFVAAAKSGKTRRGQRGFVPAQPQQTPQAMQARGFRLADRASSADSAQEWWVHPNGDEVYLVRKPTQTPNPPTGQDPAKTKEPPTQQLPPEKPPPEKKVPPRKPPPEKPGCSAGLIEQMTMALQGADTALAEAKKDWDGLEAKKAALAKLNVTTPAFAQAYEALTRMLEARIARLEASIDELKQALEAMKGSTCDVAPLDDVLESLEESLIGFGAELDLHKNDIRKPLTVDVKDDDE